MRIGLDSLNPCFIGQWATTKYAERFDEWFDAESQSLFYWTMGYDSNIYLQSFPSVILVSILVLLDNGLRQRNRILSRR